MKKTIQSIMAFAVAAFALTACSDVPTPEGYNPNQGTGQTVFEPTGTGSASDPYNVAGIIEATKDLSKGQTTTKEFYTKGYVAEIDGTQTFDPSFGNITYTIADNKEGTSKGKFIVYRGLGLNKAKFTSQDDLKVGDAVVVCGTITNFKGKIEYAQGNYLYKLNESGGGGGEEGGTEDNPYTVTAAIAKGDAKNVYTKGYIVGYNPGKTMEETVFGATGEVSVTNIVIAASADETDVTKCMAVQLPNGTDLRTKLNLKDNAGNLKKELKIYGNIETYFNVPGVKSPSYAVIDGQEIGTKPVIGAVNFNFKSDGQGEWTISDKTKPSEITNIWVYNEKYGMVATAYVSSTKTNYDSESWLISPKFDLSKLTKATLTIKQAINFFTSVDVAKTQAVVAISTDGSNWTNLTLEGWPDALGWTFFNSTVDISAYAGKKDIQLALKYISTSAKAGTWEVESIAIQ